MPARVTTDPLAAIDWGTKVNHSRIGVYFAPGGVVFGEFIYGWTPHEKQPAMLALAQYSDVANLTFRQVGSVDRADFLLTICDLGPGIEGMMQPPGEQLAGLAAFSSDVKYLPIPIDQGSYAFEIALHEFGHGLGLAHPHDTGGTSAILQGVTADEGSYGIGDLNQGVYTVMSYNVGWPGGPLGGTPDAGFGFAGTPMALDIAVLQAKYGANLDHATGDDVYRLPQANRVGTYYSCIWDAGGADSIVFGGKADCVIDLRAATLLGVTGGAGWVSHARGIHGGFTIAHGVVIEDAWGGSGNDVLRGNAAANMLVGRTGADVLIGGDGRDTLRGGYGADDLRGGGGDDRMTGGSGRDVFVVGAHGGDDRITDFVPGTDHIRIASGAEDFGDLVLHRVRGDTYVEFADVTVTLDDVRPVSLHAHDFLFN